MKKLFVLAALLTAGTYSAQAQTGTTTTTRQTTTAPATSTDTYPAQGQTTTTTQSTTTNNDQSMAVPARTKNGKTMIQPADGAKVKSNGKRVKIK